MSGCHAPIESCICDRCFYEKIKSLESRNEVILSLIDHISDMVIKHERLLSLEKLNSLDKNSGWRSAKFQPPDQDNIVLVYTDRKSYLLTDYDKKNNVFMIPGVTHWMYLPPEPT